MQCTWLGNSEDSDSDNSGPSDSASDPSEKPDIRLVAYVLQKKDVGSGDIIVYFNLGALPALVRVSTKHLLGEALTHSLADLPTVGAA